MCWAVWSKPIFIAYLLLVHPWVVFVMALVICRNRQHARGRSAPEIFTDELLAPDNWFAGITLQHRVTHASRYPRHVAHFGQLVCRQSTLCIK